MISMQIYDTPALGQKLADFTGRLPANGRVRFSTNKHGFATLRVPFVPTSLEEAFEIYEWPGTPHVVLSDEAAVVVWEGRLEDVAILGLGVRLGAFGYWRALTDAPYTALWSKTGVAGWRIVTPADVAEANPDIWTIDNNNRLYITPKKGMTFSTGTEVGALTYAAPYGGARDLAVVTFDYSFTAPTNWLARLNSYTEAWGSSNVEWGLTGNGSNQAGSATVTLTSSVRRLAFRFFNNTGGPVTTTADDGTNFLRITNIRIKSTSASTVLASSIAGALAAYANGINSDQLSASAALIEATTTDLQDELYEDALPADILDRLALLHGYECGVYEGQRLHFRPKGSAGRHWFVDVTRILELERSLDEIRNSAYAAYEDANGRRLRTAVADEAQSQARYGLVRRGLVTAQTTSATEAETHRDVFLADRADFAMRARIEFDRVYAESGAEVPLWVIQAGDLVTMRNLPPTLGTAVDNIRTFVVGFTEMDAGEGQMALEPETPAPTLVTLVARREAGL